MEKFYLCVDLKTFFASVECVERNLDPFKTFLVVADSTSKGAICLAITPKMKSLGIRNRCRMYEIPKNIKPIIVKPRMKKYLEYSSKIYEIYLEYFSSSDIYIYSIDEVFIDITPYLKMYNKTPLELAKFIIEKVYKKSKITATAGVGTNLYLAKIAMDIIAKHNSSNIGYLTETVYKEKLWHHTPLHDFWQIGIKTEERLHKLHLKDMYDISCCDEKKLYKEFGVNAKYLIDHSKGIEPLTINDLKNYVPKQKSISNSQILPKDYNYLDARKVLIEMVDNIVLRLVEKNLYTDSFGIFIGYSSLEKPLNFTKKLKKKTNSYRTILNNVLEEYDYRVQEDYFIRKIGIYLGNLSKKEYEQLDIFNCYIEEKQDEFLEKTINEIKDKYGKNSILRGVSYLEGATAKKRNSLIGGHNE